MKYKFIYFDVGGTLLYKPDLFPTIIDTLGEFGINIDEQELKKRHKLLTEIITFQKKTSKKFYDFFNSELLYSLGIVPIEEIVDSIYKNCSYLPWKKYKDTDILKKLSVPIGIISNWDTTLTKKLKDNLDFNFTHIIESSRIQSKPNPSFLKRAFARIGIPFGDILYVGDSIKLEIEPVLKLGAQAILIDRDNIYPYYSGGKITSLSEILKI